jgi:hypothetical protein
MRCDPVAVNSGVLNLSLSFIIPSNNTRLSNGVPRTLSLHNMDHSVDPRVANFATGRHYQLLDVIGEGAYGIVW